MKETIIKWYRKSYYRIIHSIGFLPATFGVAFVSLAIITIYLDKKGFGQDISSWISWMSLSEGSTALTIVSTVATGIISLTVFSFSVVLLLMNQAASQMSNRLLNHIIGDRTQKVILSFYVGTIIFSLFLLINISEKEKILVPIISVYTLLIFTITDIFLFVYFLDHIANSFRFEQLIQKIHNKTITILGKIQTDHSNLEGIQFIPAKYMVLSEKSGYYQGFSEQELVKFAEKNNLIIHFLHPKGEYILKGTPLLMLNEEINESVKRKLLQYIDYYYGQQIDTNLYYGFFHLKEVAVKALSPGINDPGTAVLCLNALTDLLSHVLLNPIPYFAKDSKGEIRVISRELSIYEIFDQTITSILDYGLKDKMIREAYLRMLEQLIFIAPNEFDKSFFEEKRRELKLE